MDLTDDITAWMAEQRVVCENQLERSQGVSPQRLLHALNLIEWLLAGRGAEGIPITFVRVQTFPMLPFGPYSAIEVCIDGLIPATTPMEALNWEQRLARLGRDISIIRRHPTHS